MKGSRDGTFTRWMIIGVLIALALLLSVSCSLQPQPQIKNVRDEHLQGQILVWVQRLSSLSETKSSDKHLVFRDMIDNFNHLHPDIQVLVKFLPASQIWKKFESQVNRGAGPDLLLVSTTPDIVPLIQTGALSAIEKTEIDPSQFRGEALKQVRYQSQMYGLPLYLSTQVLCYNRDKVSKLPSTLAELLEQARQGYSVGVLSGFGETLWGNGSFGGQVFDDRGRLNLSQGQGWAQWMKWLKEAQNEPNFILSDEVEALQKAFTAGKLAYLTCDSEWLPYFQEKLGRDSLGITLLPGEANQPATPRLRSYSLLFNQYSSTNQHQLALKLAQFMSNIQQQKQVQIELSLISSNKHVTLDESLFPLQSTLLQQVRTALALALDNAEIIALVKDYSDIMYQQVIQGDIAPNEAATKLEQAVNSHWERGN